MNNYGATLPPPPPPPPPSIPSQNQTLPGCYPPLIPGTYPQVSQNKNKMSSYPPPSMYYGVPQCLMTPYQQGVVYAAPAAPDPSNSCNSAFCAKHGKRRTLVNLQKNEKGDWVCTKANECRIVPNVGSELCSIHGKKRSLQNLVQNSKGEWVCERHDACIVVSSNLINKQLCSIHGKLRSLLHLEQRAPGMYVCREESKCYVRKSDVPFAHQQVPVAGYAPHPLPLHPYNL